MTQPSDHQPLQGSLADLGIVMPTGTALRDRIIGAAGRGTDRRQFLDRVKLVFLEHLRQTGHDSLSACRRVHGLHLPEALADRHGLWGCAVHELAKEGRIRRALRRGRRIQRALQTAAHGRPVDEWEPISHD